jgi:hypothetical protein
MIKKKKIHPYMFYGGAFSVALVAVALASFTSPEFSSAVFYSQNITDASASTEVKMYQQLSCEDITYDVASIDLMLSGGSFTSPQGLALTLGTVSGTGVWNKLKKRAIQTSGSVNFKDSEPSMVTFTFNPPVSKESLCKSTSDTLYMTLDRATLTAPHPVVYGSKTPNSYRSALYGCVLESGSPCLGDVADMAFVLHTVPNRSPVIDAVPAQTVAELATLSFTLTATDPDGDVVRWGSSNLPEGAVLNETSGVFSWTPTSEQIKEYKVTFIATDNGGPVEESSEVTITISVTDIVTTPDMNQTLLENMLSLGLEKNVENSYSAHLKNLEQFIEEGQTTAAINQLSAVQGKLVQDLEQGTITAEQHAMLLREVDALLATLEK